MFRRLVEKIIELYPSGITESGIWLRAGGDLSTINLSNNGKTQWVEALALLKNGGGGDINLQSLKNEIAKDYPDAFGSI